MWLGVHKAVGRDFAKAPRTYQPWEHEIIRVRCSLFLSYSTKYTVNICSSMNISHPLRQKEKQKDWLIRERRGGKPLLALSTWLVLTDTIFIGKEKKKNRRGPVSKRKKMKETDLCYSPFMGILLCVPVSIWTWPFRYVCVLGQENSRSLTLNFYL